MVHVILGHRLNLNACVQADVAIDTQQEQQVDQLIGTLGLPNRSAEAKAFISRAKQALATTP